MYLFLIKGCVTMKIIFLIGTILAMFGVILIYDARPITKKMFSFGDQNEATLGLKIVGFIISFVGCIIVYCNVWRIWKKCNNITD